MNQPTDAQLINALNTMRSFKMRDDDDTYITKPGLEMLSAEAGAALCRMRTERTTWCGAGELQLRLTCDKFIAAFGLKPNVKYTP